MLMLVFSSMSGSGPHSAFVYNKIIVVVFTGISGWPMKRLENAVSELYKTHFPL